MFAVSYLNPQMFGPLVCTMVVLKWMSQSFHDNIKPLMFGN